MRKRFYLFLLVIIIATALCACSDEASTAPASDSVSVFKTTSEEEYLEFLTNFDSATNTIISISADMRTYKNHESYMVVYEKAKAETAAVAGTEYRYYLYKTRSEKEFKEFYSSLDLNTFEVVDVSTHLRTFRTDESYLITYRKVVDK